MKVAGCELCEPVTIVARLRSLLAAVALDLGLLRRRSQLRLLMGAVSVSLMGSMVTFVALPLQVYNLTRSTFAVGLLGLAELVPILALALIAGALADTVDRRKLLLVADFVATGASAGLVANASLTHPRVWVLFAGALFLAGCDAVRRPPQDALIPTLVGREELKAAAAIEFVAFNVAQIAGPALGGVLIALAGYRSTYVVDAACFMVSFALITRLRPPATAKGAASPQRGESARLLDLGAILEGARYARSRPELVGTYVVDIAAMLLAIPFAVLPAIAAGHGGASTAGLLFAAPAIGSLLAALTSGWTRHVRRHGRAVVIAAIGWGLGVALFGLAGSVALGVICLALAGGADSISGIFRATIWNETIPAHLRGRLAGIEMLSWSSGPTLGNARAGLTASLFGVRQSVVAGGLACVGACAALATAIPGFWHYAPEPRAEGTTSAADADGL
jgi:MFS family permease